MRRIVLVLVLLIIAIFATLAEAQTRYPPMGAQVIITTRPLPDVRVTIVARTPREAAAALARIEWALQDYRRPVTNPPARVGVSVRGPALARIEWALQNYRRPVTNPPGRPR